jgi:hypothetical protein
MFMTTLEIDWVFLNLPELVELQTALVNQLDSNGDGVLARRRFPPTVSPP